MPVRWPRTCTFLGALGLTLLTPGSPPATPELAVPAPQGASEDVLFKWREAVGKVEEDRRERVGRQVVLTIPPELRHYDDRRRFLAVQAAETRAQHYTVPQDDADLARLVRSRELVEMSPVGEAYVLYGVGAHASGDPFAAYDRESGLDIPLYPDYLAFEQGDEASETTLREAQGRQARLQAERARLARGAARRRRALGSEIVGLGRAVGAIVRRQERAAALYDDYDQRRRLAGKLSLLQATAGELGPQPYDLQDAAGRRALRGRLLSFIRPEARDLLLEIAAGYQTAFNRPLPVTSLVRSQRYQEVLRRTNPNATALDPPPHASGLAFDVYTGLMTATEQAYLFLITARLEQAGRVEALFERNRDHIHVFVFADGARPPETLIAESLAQVHPVALARRAGARAKGPAPAALVVRPALPGLGR